MNKTTGIIIGVIVLVFIGFAAWSTSQKTPKTVDHNPHRVYTAESDVDNGGIADHIKGNPSAEVIIFEYTDYQCSGCAGINPLVNQLIEEYNGRVAVVYRHFLLSYHNNAKAAAAAVEAAALQGYWKDYNDFLFANQAEWFYDDASTRGDRFTQYFNEISAGQGDLEKFRSDMSSKSVIAKVDFDMSLGKAVDVSATPAFYLDGELINWYSSQVPFLDFMRQTIDAKLAELDK